MFHFDNELTQLILIFNCLLLPSNFFIDALMETILQTKQSMFCAPMSMGSQTNISMMLISIYHV